MLATPPARTAAGIAAALRCFPGGSGTFILKDLKIMCRRSWKSHEITSSDSKDPNNIARTNFLLVQCGATLVDSSTSIAKWPENLFAIEEDGDDYEGSMESLVNNLPMMIAEIKAKLSLVSDGEITVSAYDTAWVALVRNLEQPEVPQFPSSINWIVRHQLSDGSWGDGTIFSIHDRLLNTLACVIALTSWHLYPDICQRGLSFLSENIGRLAKDEAVLMPIGFEIVFPSLVDMARKLSLDIPFDDNVLHAIYCKRKLKLKRIPKDVLHQKPTSLLHSLEGLSNLDWEKLFDFQSSDGSFLFSPAATASALMQTGNRRCLEYLERLIKKFDGGVPNVHPIDLFERLWLVDRIERLGISRYFEREIKVFLDYVYSYWTERGICWARNSNVQDIDDTSMGFRLLRLHGYSVSPSVFNNFQKDGKFFCFAGQSDQAVTGMYNLNRATQISFPGEDILLQAKCFSRDFLMQKKVSNELQDKWIITKDLCGEVEYALGFPWYASLPRIETRVYLRQYGGNNDVWIGKTLYRMPILSNDLYLHLAKLDFNNCQVVHQLEWRRLQTWHDENNIGLHGVTIKSLLRAFFLAASCIFEPHRAVERLGWACTLALADGISMHFNSNSCSEDTRKCFITDFLFGNIHNPSRLGNVGVKEGLLQTLLNLIDTLASESSSSPERKESAQLHLHLVWKDWLVNWRPVRSVNSPFDVHVQSKFCSCSWEETSSLLVRTVKVCEGRIPSAQHITHSPLFARLLHLSSSICHHLQLRLLLSEVQQGQEDGVQRSHGTEELEMQELVQCVLDRRNDNGDDEDDISIWTGQTVLLVVKSFYYLAHCSPATMDAHIAQVIHEPVV